MKQRKTSTPAANTNPENVINIDDEDKVSSQPN
jgi:hypothetical protein